MEQGCCYSILAKVRSGTLPSHSKTSSLAAELQWDFFHYQDNRDVLFLLEDSTSRPAALSMGCPSHNLNRTITRTKFVGKEFVEDPAITNHHKF